MICHQTGWSSPMRSISSRFSSGVARGPSATVAGSPGTRKTAAYMATMTKDEDQEAETDALDCVCEHGLLALLRRNRA